MKEGWSKWEAKFSSKCGVCGLEIPVGGEVYGTKDPAFLGNGKKWFVVCPECYAADPKPKTTASVAAEIDAMKEGGVATPDKFPTDVDALAEFIKSKEAFDPGGLDALFSTDVKGDSFVWPGCDGGPESKKEPGVDPFPTTDDMFADLEAATGIDPVAAGLGEKTKPKPWTLLWLREQAVWGMA